MILKNFEWIFRNWKLKRNGEAITVKLGNFTSSTLNLHLFETTLLDS